MATTVGSHSVSAFATPVNGGPLDANVVRGNDNTIRTAYVAHDADTGIHVQSSTLASRPSAGTAGRKWITADTGSYKLWYDDGTTWHEVAAGNIDVFVIAGEALVKGDVVKVTGYNNGTGAPIVAKVASASDTAFGIITSATIANGATGYLINTGLLQDVATNAFSIGDILYPNTSGGLTATKPTSGSYQPVAYVLRSNLNNGVLYVEFSAPRIVERSDNTASTIVLRDASGNFSAGTITAGAVTSTGLVTFASLKGTGATTVTNIINDGTMATASATTLATSSSIKTYVDSQVATVDTLAEVLANGNTSGANNLIISSGQKIQTPTIAALDGTSSATIADSTGVMTIASSVLTTTDINGGTIDGTVIGGSSAAAGTFTTVAATTGNITTVNATTVDTTNIEVTNVKAKDGTASIAIADSTGVATISAAPVLSALTASQAVFTDASKGLVSNAITGTGNVVMSASPTLTGTVTADTVNATTLGGTLSTAAQGNITSVGTLSSLTVSGTGSFGGYLTLNRATDVGIALQISGATKGQITTSGSNIVEFRDPSFVTRALIDGSGNLAVDTNTLYVDATNNRVGIGTASPQGALSVSNGTIFVGSEANTSQQNNLLNGYGYRIGTTLYGNVGIRSTYENAGNSANLEFYTAASGTNTAKVMELDKSGNLGLGVTPSQRMTVRSADNTGTTNIARFESNNGNQAVLIRYAGVYGGGGGLEIGTDNASDVTFNPNSTERMRLDASGNLGVGTASPQAYSGYTTVEINNTTGGVLRLRNTGATAQFEMAANSTETYYKNVASVPLTFGTNNTERARITSGGYFKASNDATYVDATGAYHEIRTNQSDNTLYVTNKAASNPYGILMTFTAASPNDSTRYFFSAVDSTTVRARIYSNGGLANYQSNNSDLSDARTKTDITPLDSMWDKVAALEIVSYKYIDQTHDDVNLGVIAQQVETVEPVWVDTDVFGETEEGEEPFKSVYNKDITFAAIKALQEAMARIEALEAEVAALKAGA